MNYIIKLKDNLYKKHHNNIYMHQNNKYNPFLVAKYQLKQLSIYLYLIYLNYLSLYIFKIIVGYIVKKSYSLNALKIDNEF